MNRIDVKHEVEKTVGANWADFATRHPHLAAALDQELLVEQAVASLEEDPEYQAAMGQAATIGGAVEGVGPVVKRFMGDFLEKLMK
jgi:hypothetical protein